MLKTLRLVSASIAILAVQLSTTIIAKPASAQEQLTPRPAYVKVTESEFGDQVYVITKTIRKPRSTRYRIVRYSVLTYYVTPDANGAVKILSRESGNCDTHLAEIDSIVEYNSSNQIIDWMYYNMTTPSLHQSTEPADPQYAYPGTIAAATLDYVCSQ